MRWLAATLLVAVAAWSELAPPPTSREVFLVEDVSAGTPLEPHHVERRPLPAGTIDTVEPEGVAAADLKAGDPLVESMVMVVVVPAGWVVLETAVPSHAAPGAPARGIILGEGSAPLEFPALVVRQGSSDPLDGGSGTLAVPAEWIGPAAAASTAGRLVIGVETPDR